MDIANVIQRVLENKQSLLELHSADGASVYFTYIFLYFTYIYYVFEKYNYIRLQRIVVLEYYHTHINTQTCVFSSTKYA